MKVGVADFDGDGKSDILCFGGSNWDAVSTVGILLCTCGDPAGGGKWDEAV